MRTVNHDSRIYNSGYQCDDDAMAEKTHHKRRFIVKQNLARVMKDGAQLCFASDHMDFVSGPCNASSPIHHSDGMRNRRTIGAIHRKTWHRRVTNAKRFSVGSDRPTCFSPAFPGINDGR